MQKRLLAFSFLLALSHSLSADIESSLEKTKDYIRDVKCQTLFYAPYVVGATVGMSGFSLGSRFGASLLVGLGLYGLYSTYSGYRDLKVIENKYCVKTKPTDFWHEADKDERFLFCRWRQQDDRFGDGYYWPTAWLCKEERQEVRKKLIQDIHAGQIVIKTNGKKVISSKPVHLIKAINIELDQLEHDKMRLQAYTNVYRNFKQPEAFSPDISGWRVFWPNYNHASKLYIEVVQMMKRLEVLREIVASICSEMPGGGWPKA